MGVVKWTEDVLADMAGIHEYIAKDSVAYADKLLDSFFERVQVLVGQPNSGRVVPEKNDVSVREVFEGNYRVVYTTKYLPDIIILRVLRFSQRLV